MTELSELFRSLPTPTEIFGFTGVTIPNTHHHLGKDVQGRPAVLFRVAAAPVRPASMVLQNLRVEHAVHCRITIFDVVLDDQFSVIHCQSTNELLQSCFLDLAEAILQSLPPAPTAAHLSDAVQRMAVLFLALENATTRTVQGLWAELFLIANSTEPAVAAESWHNEAAERYDFALALCRLEVKSSGDRTRNHHFSFEQVYPAAGLNVVIASLFVERSTGGISLGELWDSVRSRVTTSPDLRLKVDEICLRSLGNSWSDARGLSFDEQLARQSLAFYDVRDIPRLDSNVPNGISEIRFRSDLSLGQTVFEANRPIGALLYAISAET